MRVELQTPCWCSRSLQTRNNLLSTPVTVNGSVASSNSFTQVSDSADQGGPRKYDARGMTKLRSETQKAIQEDYAAPDWYQLPQDAIRLIALQLDRPSLAAWLRSCSCFPASIRPATAFHTEWHHMRRGACRIQRRMMWQTVFTHWPSPLTVLAL